MQSRAVFSEPPDSGILEELRQSMAGKPRALPAGAALDAAGHALFARVTALPEYTLSRAETDLLRSRRDEILQAAAHPREIVDLEAGSSVRARPLLEGAEGYVAIERCRPVLHDTINSLAAALPRLRTRGVVGEAVSGVASVPRGEGPRLILLLGGALGRYDAAGARLLLWRIRAEMSPRDRLLVGVDLDKEPRRLLDAYRDPAGVVSAYLRNAFRRVNREVGTDFRPGDWDERVEVQSQQGRVEIRYEARKDLVVFGGRTGGDWAFGSGEPLVVEHAYKPSEAQVAAIALGGGFGIAGVWTDPAQGYGLFMLGPRKE